jgi:hypothetical protein
MFPKLSSKSEKNRKEELPVVMAVPEARFQVPTGVYADVLKVQELRKLQDQVEQLTSELKKSGLSMGTLPGNKPPYAANGPCFKCGKEGHIRARCFPCYRCGEIGHFKRECTKQLLPGESSDKGKTLNAKGSGN